MKGTLFVGIVASLSAVVAATSLHAETIEFTNGSVSNPSIWSVKNSDLTNETYWANGEEPSSDYDYRIYGTAYASRKYCGIGGTGTFKGNSLRLEGQSANLVLNANADWTFSKFTLKGGVIYVKAGTSTLRGPVEVLVGDKYQAITSGNASNTRLTFTGAFTGSIWTGINVQQDAPSSYPNDLKSVTVFKGDMSQYLGKLTVGGGSGNWGRAYFGDTHVGAQMTINATGTIAPCGTGTDGQGEFSASTLTLKAGATILSSLSDTTGGCVRVTQTLTMPADGKVNLKITALPTISCRRVLLVTPCGTGLEPEQFNLLEESPITAYVKTVRSELLVEKDDREERLVFVIRKGYTLGTSDAWNQSALELAYSDHWTGVAKNTPLDPDGAYYLDDAGWSGKTLATSQTSAGGTVRFGGYSLTAATRATIQIYASLDIDRLYLYGSTSIGYGSTQMSRTVSGRIFTLASTADDYVNIIGKDASRTFYIRSEISGPAGLAFSTRKSWYGDYASPVFHLTATNTALSGKIRVTNENPSGNFSTLVVADARSLGGAMSDFAYNGIELMNKSLLKVTASTEFVEPTRGWFISGRDRISIPNASDEVKVRAQLTMAGTFVKEGDGTLALGGACRFTAEQLETPLAGTNVLEVAAGRIKPIAKDGYDGLAIKFAAGTGIELPLPDDASADVKTYGLYDVAWATPFDLSNCGGKLNVGFRDVTGVGADQTIETAVCTVASAAAPALRGNIKFVKVPKHRVTFSERDNGDGTVTFLATVEPTGSVVILR